MDGAIPARNCDIVIVGSSEPGARHTIDFADNKHGQRRKLVDDAIRLNRLHPITEGGKHAADQLREPAICKRHPHRRGKRQKRPDLSRSLSSRVMDLRPSDHCSPSRNGTFLGISKLTCIEKGGFLYTSRLMCIENGLSLYTFTLISSLPRSRSIPDAGGREHSVPGGR